MRRAPSPLPAADRAKRQIDDAVTALIGLIARQVVREAGAGQNPKEAPLEQD